MPNVWTDVLVGRLTSYVMLVLEESEHFDFMTLMRRIWSNKTLMNFQLIIEKGLDVAEAEDFNPADFHEKVFVRVLPKVIHAFNQLNRQVSVEDMRDSTYFIRPGMTYTFMEAYWIYLAWLAFGEDRILPANFYHQILEDCRESIRLRNVKPNEPHFIMVAVKENDAKKVRGQKKLVPPESAVDIVQMLLQRMDHKLLAVKENFIKGKSRADEASMMTVYH